MLIFRAKDLVRVRAKVTLRIGFSAREAHRE